LLNNSLGNHSSSALPLLYASAKKSLQKMLPQLAHADHYSPESSDWTAHNQALTASSEVFENQCIVLMVDESQAGASGCSIDKSVHFLEDLGRQIGADFFERMRFAWADENGQLHFAARPELTAARQSGAVTDRTPMLNTLVQNRRELLEKWLVPFGESWHRRVV
jgi:hypothetical protein